jgi:ribosomal 50S subunit-recycling heat shock protein
VLTIALPSRVRVLKVLDVAERRGPASDAVILYEELG